MQEHECLYSVGDIVTIREWDSMVAEFGLDLDGNIPCRCTFIREMKDLCGRKLEITYSSDGVYRVGEHRWSISEDMICGRSESIYHLGGYEMTDQMLDAFLFDLV